MITPSEQTAVDRGSLKIRDNTDCATSNSGRQLQPAVCKKNKNVNWDFEEAVALPVLNTGVKITKMWKQAPCL